MPQHQKKFQNDILRSSPDPASPGQTYYDVLKLDIRATDDDIKKSYRELVQIWHPDKNRGNAQLAEVKTRKINEAYRQLINTQTRSRYDRTLQNRRIAATEKKTGKTGSARLLKQFLVWLKSGD